MASLRTVLFESVLTINQFILSLSHHLSPNFVAKLSFPEVTLLPYVSTLASRSTFVLDTWRSQPQSCHQHCPLSLHHDLLIPAYDVVIYLSGNPNPTVTLIPLRSLRDTFETVIYRPAAHTPRKKECVLTAHSVTHIWSGEVRWGRLGKNQIVYV